MAKGKYEKWLEPEGLLLLEGWARDGLTDDEIAKKIGCSASTLSAALDGNTTAQIFWLKNRRPDRWRDKPAPEENPAQQAAASRLFDALEKES